MTNQDFTKDLEKLILDFIDEKEVSGFCGRLLSKVGLSTLQAGSLSDLDRGQLNAQFTPANERFQIDRTVTFAEKKLSTERYHKLLINLGQVCISHGKLNLAYEILTKAKRESRKSDVSAEAMLVLSDFYSRKADWKKSISSVRKAEQLYKKESNKSGTAKCENILGTIYGEQGNLKKAKLHFEKSLASLDKNKDAELAATLEVNIGIIYNIYEEYEKALSYFSKAYDKFREMGNLRRIAELKHNIGMVYTEQKYYHSALSEFDQSIQLALDSGYQTILGLSYLAKANILLNLEEYQIAGAFADKAMEVCHRIDDKLSIADVYKIKGIIERNKKNYQLSENFFLSSLRLNKKMENSLNVAECSYELSVLYEEMERYEEVKSHLEDSLTYYRKIKADEHVRKIEEKLTAYATA